MRCSCQDQECKSARMCRGKLRAKRSAYVNFGAHAMSQVYWYRTAASYSSEAHYMHSLHAAQDILRLHGLQSLLQLGTVGISGCSPLFYWWIRPIWSCVTAGGYAHLPKLASLTGCFQVPHPLPSIVCLGIFTYISRPLNDQCSLLPHFKHLNWLCSFESSKEMWHTYLTTWQQLGNGTTAYEANSTAIAN